MIPRAIVFILLNLIIYGCAQVPTSVTYPYISQQKMQAAYHWGVLAEDVATQVSETLKAKNLLTESVFIQPYCGTPSEPCSAHNETPFGEGFTDLLLTKLVNSGVKVSTDEKNALIVTSKVQVVYHRANRDIPKIGALAVLTAGVFVLREAFTYWDTPARIAAVAGTALVLSEADDSTNGFFAGRLPHHEIIISTSILKDKSYLMRKSDIYYINDADFWHYKPSPVTTTLKVVE
jgi:hypothetical protein